MIAGREGLWNGFLHICDSTHIHMYICMFLCVSLCCVYMYICMFIYKYIISYIRLFFLFLELYFSVSRAGCLTEGEGQKHCGGSKYILYPHIASTWPPYKASKPPQAGPLTKSPKPEKSFVGAFPNYPPLSTNPPLGST